jgi:carotenoid 1,2-hydratase
VVADRAVRTRRSRSAQSRAAVVWFGILRFHAGDAPLEDAFARWDWSRAGLRRGTAVLYDVVPREGTQRALAARFDPSGAVEHFAAQNAVRLPRSRWRVQRGTRAEGEARVLRTLEDGLFYVRTVLSTRLLGEQTLAMHESLGLDRFRKAWVRVLLPFRMPRPWR